MDLARSLPTSTCEIVAANGELIATTDPSIDDTYHLFADALSAAGGNAKRAWKVTLVGMLSDLRALFY